MDKDKQYRIHREGLMQKAKVEAEAMLDGIRAKQLARLEEFNKDHLEDVDGYNLQAEKFGSFLALKLKRGTEKYAGAIRLQDVLEFSVTFHGVPPGMNGIVNVIPNTSYGPNNKMEDETITPIESGPYVWRRGLISIPVPVVSHASNNCGGGGYHGGGGGYGFTGSTIYDVSGSGSGALATLQHCANPATDDQITFKGTGITLYLPQGLGDAYYQKLLEALRHDPH